MRHFQLESFPLHNIIVSSEYGMRQLNGESKTRKHDGIDLRALSEIDITAVCSGTVIKAEERGQVRFINHKIIF